jgi:hypothetical protein
MLQPVIVTGCRRSGTTLLMEMLAQHPDLLVHPKEPQFIREGYARFGDDIRNVPGAVTYLTSHPYCPDNIESARFGAAVQGRSSMTYLEFIHKYLELWGADALLMRRPVLKDPAFIYSLDWINCILPGVQIIHVVRDPRGNISSQLARWNSARLWECLRRWRSAVHAGRRWGASKPDSYFQLHYEELVIHPEASLRGVCRFLHIPYKEGMLQFDLHESQYSPGGENNPVVYHAADPSRLEVWRDQLDDVEVAIIEKQTRGEADYWAFPATITSIPFWQLTSRTLAEQILDAILRSGRWVKASLRHLRWLFEYR